RRRIGKWSRGLERVFEDVLKEGVRRGEFRSDLDTRLAVLGILGMANAVANWYRTEEVAVGRISAEFARLVVGGVLKRPKARRRWRGRRRAASGPGCRPSAAGCAGPRRGPWPTRRRSPCARRRSPWGSPR